MQHPPSLSSFDSSTFEHETDVPAHAIPPPRSLSMSRPADRAVEAAQIGTWEWRLHTQHLAWSPEADAIFGLTPGAFDRTFEGFLKRVHPGDRPGLEAAIHTAVAGRQPYHMEHRILLPDGTIRWVSCRGRAITDEHGEVCGMAGTTEDITSRKETEFALRDLQQTLEQRIQTRTAELEQTVRELKQEIARREQTESALKNSEQRYQALYEHNPSMYFTLAPDGIILSVNGFGAEELGYRQTDLIGRSVLHIFQPHDHHTVLEQLAVCSEHSGKTFDWEIQKVRKNGSRLWVRERARAIIDPRGQPMILIVCEDITDRRRAEDAIRERDARLRATTQFLHTLVRESPLPIISLDAHAKVTSWNQAAAGLFGWTEQEVLGRELPYVPPDQEAESESLWHQGVRNMVHGPIPIRRQRKDGSPLDLLLWPVFVYDETGHLATAVGLYVDRSDLQRAEEGLRESESRFRAFAAAMPDIAFVLDEHGRYVEILGHGEDLLYADASQLKNRLLHEVLPKADADFVLSIIRKTVDTGQSQHVEYPLKVKAGLLWFEGHTSLMQPVPGKIKQVVWVAHDITDRKQAELALRISEERFEIAFRSSPHPVVITELATGRCIEVNDTALELFGFQREDVIGHTTLAIHLWPSADDRARFIGQLLQNGTLRGVEFSFHTKDRRRRDCLVSSELIDLNGVRCILTVGTDITEKKEAEAALRDSEERWQRFVADAPVGLVVVDADKQIISANKAFCALTGYSEREVIDNTYALYTHPDDLPKNLELTEEFFSGQRDEYAYEKRYVRKNGEIIWVSIRASRLAVHGYETPLLLAVVEDITDRKQALADRERLSQDLHDNILQSLYAVGMQLEPGKLLAGKAPRKSKQHVTHAIRQLNHLVLEVRQFITGLTQRTAPVLNFGVAMKQLVASFLSDEHGMPALEIDPEAIASVTPAVGEQLLNITREAFSNSLRHARAAHRSVSLSLTGTRLRLRIADDGLGFDATRKRRRGHGLANMAARARTIRAEFTLDSAPGRGTVVTIDVPTGGPHVR